MAESCFGFDLNVRLEDDDDSNLPLDPNKHEGDDRNAGFDLNEPEDDEHGNGFDLNLPLDEFGAVDFDYVQNLAEQDVETPVQVHPPKHDYPEHVRKQVYQALLMTNKNGKLGKQDITIVAGQFGVNIRSV